MNTMFVLALAAALLLPPVLNAEDSPGALPDDPEDSVVSELIVRAPTPGPGWWRISKGDSVVWVLGMPAGALPKDTVWDRSALERRLTGARALLLPPRAVIGFGSRKGNVLGLVRFLPGIRQVNGDVEKDMPAELGERFDRVRSRLGKPVRRYATPVPLLAGFKLQNDFMNSAGLQQSGGWSEVEAAAKRKGVSSVRPATVKAGTLDFADVDLARPEAAACLDALLDSAEAPMERYRAAASGWARGDLRVAVSAPRDPLSVCENRLLQQGYTRRSIDGQVKAIEAALTNPGKTVAVSHLRTLLAPDGILERLAADGYTIVDPSGAQDLD